MKQRVQWIDTTKGIGMLLVILGHFMNDNMLVDAIYIFHIPLFFIMSGYLFDINKGNKTFLESKLRGLVLPYFSLGIPIIAAQMIFGKEEFLQDGVLHYIVQQKYTTMWFLACLVIVNILAFILLKISSKNWVILTLAFLLLNRKTKYKAMNKCGYLSLYLTFSLTLGQYATVLYEFLLLKAHCEITYA